MKAVDRGRSMNGDPAARPGIAARRAAPALLATLLLGALAARAEVVRLDAAAAAARAAAASDLTAAATERVHAAEATVQAADAARWPTLGASLNLGQRSSVPAFKLPLALPGQAPLVLSPDITTTYAAGLRAQQALWTGGAIRAQRLAAREDVTASRARATQVTLDLRFSGQAAYWEAVRAAAARDAAHSQQRRAQRLLDDTRALLAAGMAVRADVLAAEERAASAAMAVVRAETTEATARATLRSLLHLPAGATVELSDSLAGPLPATPGAVETLAATALAERPELAAAGAQMDAARAREELTLAPVRPGLAAVVQWDYARPNQRYFPVTDTWHDSWAVGVAASWTLFDGGKARADHAGSRAQQQALARDRAEWERRIRLEVENAHRELLAALASVAAADAARAAAQARHEAATERLAAGLAPMVEILDAETALANAEQQQVTVRAGAWLAAAALQRAVGQ